MTRYLDGCLDAFGWLLWIVMGTAPLIWGYEKFIHWTPICVGGCSGSRTFVATSSPVAYKKYAVRVRTQDIPRLKRLIGQNADLIAEFKRGHRQAFERDSQRFCEALLDSTIRLDSELVPDCMKKSHDKLALSHRYCYESIQALREAREAEGAERVRLVKEAEKKLKEASTAENTGLEQHRRESPPVRTGRFVLR